MMINERSISFVNGKRLGQHFYLPAYGSYCFSELPNLISAAFSHAAPWPAQIPPDLLPRNATKYEQVVLVFVDAFGWKFFERFVDELPFLQKILEGGVCSCITSQFPSTTAAHVTTIHTGLPVSSSGVYEWFYYEPKLGEVIAPLLYSLAGDQMRGTLTKRGVVASDILPNGTFYNRLAEQDVKSFVFQYQGYTSTPFSDLVFRGSTVCPFREIGQGINRLAAELQVNNGPSYYFLYIDAIDSVAHHAGPDSPEFENEVRRVFTLLDEKLLQATAGKLKNTLLLVTADHGQISVDPSTTYYLNREIPDIEKFLQKSPSGRTIKFSGSPRDLFLHALPESKAELLALLEKKLEGKAAVLDVEKYMLELFGPGPYSPDLLGRLGNVLILPYAHETVFWYEQGRFEMKFKGHHGGLSSEELHTTLLAMEL